MQVGIVMFCSDRRDFEMGSRMKGRRIGWYCDEGLVGEWVMREELKYKLM